MTRIEGKGKPKIGVAEFMSLTERFGFSRETLGKIRDAVEAEDPGAGPFLANYYSGLKESKVQAFERVARDTFGSKYAIGMSSGTGALHSAFVAAGIGPGTEVITSAIGFYATAAAIVTAKGVPVFCDVDESLGMDPAKIEKLITKRTVAIAATQVLGSVCDMGAIMKVARKHKLRVIEDCAQSCGATFKGKRVGTFGDLGCFSISAYKILGAGRGGLGAGQDEADVGTSPANWPSAVGLWRADRFGAPRYEGELFSGTNYRMSELEAAVDVIQLKRLQATVKRSNAVKRRILAKLKAFKEIVPQRLNDADGELGYVLRFFPETIELGQRIVEALRAEGVGCGIRGKNPSPNWHIYHEMYPITMRSADNGPDCAYTCPHYLKQGGKAVYARGDCPVADDLFDRVIDVGLNQWYTARDCANVAARHQQGPGSVLHARLQRGAVAIVDGFGAETRFEAIAEFSDLSTAELYQSLLIESGIQAFVQGADAHALQLSRLSEAFGLSRGIRLCVPGELAEEARRVMDEFDERASNDADEEDGVADDAVFEGDRDEEEMMAEGDGVFEEQREDTVPEEDLYDKGPDDTASDAGDTGGLALLVKWLLIAVVGVVLFRLSLFLF